MQAAADDRERLARLRLIRSENIGPINFVRMLRRFGSARDALRHLPEMAARAGRRNLRIAKEAEVTREWADTERAGARFVMLGDADYPPLLAETDGAPPVLSVRGDMGLLQRPSIAIVGARNASSNGRTLCRRIAGGLSEAGVTVVSGLARGIDAEAHMASLGGGAVAAVAGGIDIVYPPEHEALQAQLAEQGLLLAESRLGTEPRARHFPRRNRIISGVSLGVAVIEAAARSGSLITARQAGEQGREVFAVPGSPLDPRARGANSLIRDGAQLVENADDILALIARSGMLENVVRRPQAAGFEDMAEPDDQQGEQGRKAILEALSAEPADADALMRAAGLSAALFNALVMELEIAGLVSRHAGNRFARHHPD